MKTGMTLTDLIYCGPSLAALILANIIPVVGVLFLGWSVFDLMLLFWAENLVIGVLHVVRMYVVYHKNGPPPVDADPRTGIGFFSLQYFFFAMIHGIAILAIFSGHDYADGPFQIGAHVHNLYEPILIGGPLFLAWFSVAVSHLFSFFYNFIGHQEWRYDDPATLYIQPYRRIFILHLTVFFGALIAKVSDEHMIILILLVVLKIAMDAHAHIKSHMIKGERQ